jgi:hypothetical protein
MEAKKRRIGRITVESVPKWETITRLVILRVAFFCGLKDLYNSGSTDTSASA